MMEELKSTPRESFHETSYRKSGSGDDILLLIVSLRDDEVVKPAVRIIVIRIDGNVIIIFVIPHNGL